jgi:putative peptide zinc metalloprotease protein
LATYAPPATRDVERRKQVRIRLRGDLEVSEQKYEGRTYRVVKDPVSLRYYRFDEQEYFLIQYCDGTHTLDETQKEFEKRFRPKRLTLEDLEGFAQQLLTAGLVYNESPQGGKQLFDRRKKRLRREWLQTFTNILYIKIPVFDPDWLLGKMLPYLRWIFTVWFGLLSLGVVLAALILVASHFEQFRDKLPSYHQFFTFKTAGYLWLATILVKVIHEFGHGLSCKAFGGECHEMGLLFLCLAPALYCNVSDAWTIPNKWKRMLISFAGIYVELMIASIACFVWWNTHSDSFVKNLSLALMVLCSLNTVFFNGNPLLRYDGYYVLFDWLEIPNLRERSNRFLLNLFQEHCLGVEVLPEPYTMTLRRRALFVGYAIVSYIYRWYITFAILYFMSQFLKPYKLGALSNMLAVAAAASMIGWPLYRMGQSYHKRGRLPDMQAPRVTATVTVITIVVLCFLLVPLPVSRVRQQALVEVQPGAAEKVFVTVPGTLEHLYVRDGQHVEKGDLLAEFRDIDMENKLDEAQSQYDIRVGTIRSLREQADETSDPAKKQELQTQIESAIGERDGYAHTMKLLEETSERLILRAPRSGTVMSSPRVDEIGRRWEKENDSPFCTIGDLSQLRVLMPVSPADYRVLKENMQEGGELDVDIRIQGRGGQIWKGKISQLPESEAFEVPYGLTDKAGGPLAIKQSARQTSYQPQDQQYLIGIDILNPDQTIRPGNMAQAKVHCHWRPAAWWVWRWISSKFDIPLI